MAVLSRPPQGGCWGRRPHYPPWGQGSLHPLLMLCLRQPPLDAQGLATGGAPAPTALLPRGTPKGVGPVTQQQGVRASVVPVCPHPVPPWETAAQSSFGALFPLYSISSRPCPTGPRLIRGTRMAQRWPPNHIRTSEKQACWATSKEGSSLQGGGCWRSLVPFHRDYRLPPWRKQGKRQRQLLDHLDPAMPESIPTLGSSHA